MSRVDPLVFLQGVILGERLVTLEARIWFLSSMSFHVCLQVI